MGYFVGTTTIYNRTVGIERYSPFGVGNDTFTIRNNGSALVLELSLYYKARYELPQGTILASIFVNNRLVVDDIPVTDRLLTSDANTHIWSFTHDVAASDLEKVAGELPLRIQRVEVKFRVNEDALRSIKIEEYDRNNALDRFKQEVARFASASAARTFVFATGIRHDFTTTAPLVANIQEYVNFETTDNLSASGYRLVVAPLVDVNGFAVTRLFRIDVYDASYDTDGVVTNGDNTTPTYSFTLANAQLSLVYKNAFKKEETSLGPVNSALSSTHRAGPAFLDSLPATSYVDHALQLDPGGASGFHFLDPTAGRVGLSTSLLIRGMLTRLSLSLYFAVKRDVTAELLIQARSDLSVGAALVVQ